MRDEQHGTFVGRQGRDQHLLGGDVEMIGGLVEHQEVRRVEQHPRHGEPRLLAARQDPAALFDIVAGEPEAAGQGPERALAGLRKGILERLEDGALALEHIHGVLGEIAHLDAPADRNRPVVGIGRARHELQQRRLAGAVDAHDAPALPTPDGEIKPLVDAQAAIALVDVLQAHDIVARAWRRGKVERHALPPLRRFDTLDLVELLHPTLHLRRMGGAGLEAFDELDLLGEHRLLAFELGLLVPLVQRALLGVEIVVARIGGEAAAVDLQDLADDAGHERPIVRRHEQGAVVALEKGLEPDQAFEVEMIARLVEQHGVGAHQKDARECHPHLPSARERADVAVHHLWAEAQARQHFARLGIERIAAPGPRTAPAPRRSAR